MKKLANTFSVLFLFFLLSGCGVQKAALEVDTKAKQLSVPADKALIYIVRPSSFGFAVRFNADCDGKHIGATGGKRFIYTIQNAGKHKLVSYAENDAELEIIVEAGKAYFIEQIPAMGLIKARNKLVMLSEGEGREKLKECKLSVDCVEK